MWLARKKPKNTGSGRLQSLQAPATAEKGIVKADDDVDIENQMSY